MGLAGKVLTYAAMIVAGLVLWMTGLGLALSADGPQPEAGALALLGLVLMVLGFMLMMWGMLAGIKEALKHYPDCRPYRYPYC